MRVKYVKSAQKDSKERCKCGETIKRGEGYSWFQFRYSPRTVRHTSCGSFRQSEMTRSKMSAIYAAQENAEDALSALGDDFSKDDIESIANDVAEAIREVAEEYRESQSNMVDGFGHDTYKSDELGEKADELDSWADEVENALDSIDDFDEDDEEFMQPTSESCEECDGTGEVDDGDADTEHEKMKCEACDGTGEIEGDSEIDEDARDAARSSWCDDARSALEDAMSSCPV